MLVGFVVLDGKSIELTEFFRRAKRDLDLASGTHIRLIGLGDPDQSGGVHKSLRTPQQLEDDARDAKDYVEQVYRTGRETDHLIEEMAALQTMLGLTPEDVPCIAFVSKPGAPPVGVLRISTSWHESRSAERILHQRLQSWLARDDVKRLAADWAIEERLAEALDLSLQELATEISTAVACNNADGPQLKSGQGNVFRWDGEHWHIVWRGEELPRIRPLDGIQVIHYLLSHPHQDFELFDLLRVTLEPPRVLRRPDYVTPASSAGVCWAL